MSPPSKSISTNFRTCLTWKTTLIRSRMKNPNYKKISMKVNRKETSLLLDHLLKTLHAVLGLTMEASEAQIKKAYRKLSLKYHPDKQKDEKDAEKMFHKIARAYEVLSDPDKRQIYDLEGFEGLKREEQGGGKQQSPFGIASNA